uniref:Uncharacterized protein n=1 Tax=Knipowitschia caucasica TaxID=637954 RepID=A0AAV2L0C8_KNICA
MMFLSDKGTHLCSRCRPSRLFSHTIDWSRVLHGSRGSEQRAAVAAVAMTPNTALTKELRNELRSAVFVQHRGGNRCFQGSSAVCVWQGWTLGKELRRAVEPCSTDSFRATHSGAFPLIRHSLDYTDRSSARSRLRSVFCGDTRSSLPRTHGALSRGRMAAALSVCAFVRRVSVSAESDGGWS